jgi:hypothetical protein
MARTIPFCFAPRRTPATESAPLNERIEQGADVFSFLFDQLGIKYVPVAK